MSKKIYTKDNSKWRNAEIPIVIGISCKGNVASVRKDALRDCVNRFLDTIEKLCPHTSIIILSGLREGVEQLCAETAVMRDNVSLCVARTKDENEYRNDFSESGRAKYDEIINSGKIKENFIVGDIEKRKIKLSKEEYDERQQEIYLAMNSHILLTVRDKNDDKNANRVIDFALNQNYFQGMDTAFYSSYDGAVFAIDVSDKEPTCRGLYYVAAEHGKSNAESVYEEYSEIPQKLKQILVRTDKYNKDKRNICTLAEKNKVSIYDDPLIGETEYENGGDRLKAIHDCQIIASALSGNNKRNFLKTVKALSVFGMAFILAFMLYDQLAYLWTCIVCLAMLAVIFTGFVISRLRQDVGFGVHTRFIEYRALSETLRVQYYIAAYGLNDNVCRHFAWSHKNTMVWVKKAVTALLIGESELLWNNDKVKSYYAQHVSECVLKIGNDSRNVFENRMFSKWVGYDKSTEDSNNNGQIGYHLKNCKKTDKMIKDRKVASIASLVITCVTYIALFVLECIPCVDMTEYLFWIIDARILGKCVLSIFTALTFLTSYYYDKLSLEQNKKDSEHMVALYGIAMDRVSDINKSDFTDSEKRVMFESLMIALAKEQLIENGTWISYNLDNSIDLPI